MKESIDIIQVGNIVHTGNWGDPQRGRIYSAEGISPALNTCGGGGLEPKIIEPNVLTPKRTEFGKRIRGDYERGTIKISRHKMTELVPRDDGISNTITTVQKDNLLLEPMCSVNPIGRKLEFKGDRNPIKEICPALRACDYKAPHCVWIFDPVIAAMRGRDKDNPSFRGKSSSNFQQRLEINSQGISNTITTVQKDNLVIEPIEYEKGHTIKDEGRDNI